MEIESVKLAYFSPTGTTKAIVQAVAGQIKPSATELIDITLADGRKQLLKASEKDLLVVGVPVYAGRVPVLVSEWLQTIETAQTPTVCIVVYGNRDFDDALLELKDIIQSRGGVPIAGAAFIGEHSLSNAETPIAVARPDASDLSQAEAFGRKIEQILPTLFAADKAPDLEVPGKYPYRELMARPLLDFIAVSDECIQCGTCAQVCPVGAVDALNSSLMAAEKCIRCCACIKACPQQARSVKVGPVKDTAIRLYKICQERKEPVFFF